jgi:hypothetical protein
LLLWSKNSWEYKKFDFCATEFISIFESKCIKSIIGLIVFAIVAVGLFESGNMWGSLIFSLLAAHTYFKYSQYMFAVQLLDFNSMLARFINKNNKLTD